MRKFRFLAMLALVLVLGLSFTSCGGGEADVPKTIPGLFDLLKDSGVGFSAYNSSTQTNMRYCSQHTRWEGYDNTNYTNHDLPQPFELSDATSFSGGTWYTPEEEANYAIGAGLAKEVVKKLNTFYTKKYKLDSAPQKLNYTMNGQPIPDDTPVAVWYNFYLQSNGTGQYGGSATKTTFPLYVQSYKF